MTVVRVVDLETTGLPPDAEVAEIACVDVDVETRKIERGWRRLVRPVRPMPPEASAVHHLVDADLVDEHPWSEVWPEMVPGADVLAYCAHNAKFEQAFVVDGMRNFKPFICTWKCALRLWPNLSTHSNQGLRYALSLPIARAAASPPHRALPDARVTAHLLVRMLGVATVEDLVAWSAEPALLPRVPMGKHRGKRWGDVPDGYLDWVIRDIKDNEDVAHCAAREQERRRELSDTMRKDGGAP